MKGDLTMAQLSKALFSSTKEDWATPQDFFDKLNEEFHFDLDPCADAENAKCKEYFTKEENGLLKDWGGRRVFCNPPYGRKTTGEWIRKCYEEAKKPGTVVVALIPARTDTRFFHDYIYHKAEIRFIKGRLKFGGCKDAAPFPSMVVIFGKEKEHEETEHAGSRGTGSLSGVIGNHFKGAVCLVRKAGLGKLPFFHRLEREIFSKRMVVNPGGFVLY